MFGPASTPPVIPASGATAPSPEHGSVSGLSPPRGSTLNAGAGVFTPMSAFSGPVSAFSGPSSSPFQQASIPSVSTPFGNTRSPNGQVSSVPKSVFGTPSLGSPQPQAKLGEHVPAITASTHEGEHIPTTQLRQKRRPRWRTVESRPVSGPISPRVPKDVPPYRVPPNVQREIEQGKYDSDQRFPGNRFLEVSGLTSRLIIPWLMHTRQSCS